MQLRPGASANETVCLQAVIGAGPAGLVAARELKREGHSVTMLEQMHEIGGVWLWNDGPVDIAIKQDHGSTAVNRSCSMYASLRTNLPRELMGFSDLPFLPKFMRVRTLLRTTGVGHVCLKRELREPQG